MRITTTPIALLALPALIHAHSVSLIDFVPRVNDISGACNKVYQQIVTGCESTDFSQQGCSVSCVKGLASMTRPVKDACANEGLLDGDKKDSNVLAMFLQDRGPQSLCTNADEVLQSSSSSATSKELSSTAEPTQHSSTSEQSSTAIVSSTATASITDVPTSLVVDTSSSPEATSSTSSTASESSSGSSSTSTESSQIFQAPSMPASWASTGASSEPTASSEHSGGGSPFDAEGNQFSAATATSSSAVMLLLAVAFAALAAQW